MVRKQPMQMLLLSKQQFRIQGESTSVTDLVSATTTTATATTTTTT